MKTQKRTKHFFSSAVSYIAAPLSADHRFVETSNLLGSNDKFVYDNGVIIAIVKAMFKD